MVFEHPKVSILLREYPTYKLFARVLKANEEEFNQTLDESLILYKYCDNVRNYSIPDYKYLLDKHKKNERKEHFNHRIAQGFRST